MNSIPSHANSHLETREWKLRTELEDSASELPFLIQTLQAETGLTPTALRVCIARGLRTTAEIQDFLSPRLDSLKDPFCLKDMLPAVERLILARERGEFIRIYGDYDVDGTTGAALLSWIFRDCGVFKFDARQPDRFKDGYGLAPKAIQEAHAENVKVMITVDCGITSFDAALKARELGMDLIVVDHHQVDPIKGIPEAFAVINPQRADCASDLKQLCGCGVAFYLARALRTRGKELGWWQPGMEPNLKQHLDLVVMATAADMVPLTGDNHTLVRHGLEVLKFSKKPGVRALLEVAGVGSRDLTPGHLGFVIGPRINASGRIASASLALELLTTTDAPRAMELAKELEKLNQERAALQNRIWDEVRTQVEQGLAEGKFKHGIVVAHTSWHEGVVGIVASRVTETYRKPAAVLALREDFGKGSVRSYAGKSVLDALRASSETLLGFGGHKHAAGLSVALDQVEAFAHAFDQALGSIAEDLNARPLLVEGDCLMSDLDVRTLQEIEHLGPFGPGNPEPVFVLRAAARSHSVLKGRHLKLNLTSDVNAIEAIWFHVAEKQEFMEQEEFMNESEWAGVPELNRFRGRITPTLRVRDWRRLAPN